MPRPTKTPSIQTQAGRNEPTEEDIRQRAFELYEARGGRPGSEQDDWEQARRELTQGMAATREPASLTGMVNRLLRP